jgi:holo-[acyl-carrier protein] synthase
MISGTGIDIVEVERIQRSIVKSENFKKLVFSPEEINYCENEGSGFQSYAGRFAAKEAFFKALGTGWSGDLAFHEVSVLNDKNGKPFIKLFGETLKIMDKRSPTIVHVSISHSKHYATAVVIIENQ